LFVFINYFCFNDSAAILKKNHYIINWINLSINKLPTGVIVKYIQHAF
jgi:hypothetical protein